MDPRGGSNSDQNHAFAGTGAKKAAEQALMNEVLETSPLVPSAAMTQQVYPRQNPVFPTGHYMGAPGMMVPNGHVGVPRVTPYVPMAGGHAMPPHGYPGANPYAYPGANPNSHPGAPPNAHPGMPGFPPGVSGMPTAGGSKMTRQGYSGATNSVPAMFPFPMQGERDNGTTNKRRLDGAESGRRVSQKTDAPTALQPPQVEVPQQALDSKPPAPTTNDASHTTGPTAAVAGPVQGKKGSSNHESSPATAPPLSSIDDDIFADADDDVPADGVSTAIANSGAPVASLQSPSNKMKSPPRANYQSQSLSPDQRPSIRNIVLGNAGKVVLAANKPISVSAKNPVSKKPSNVATKKPSTVPSVVVRVGEKEKAPKRKTRPTRRVLIAKKEKEQATNLLQGVGDLLEWLPKGDCKFLAENFWIFTKDQLQWVLTQSQDQKEGLATEGSSKEATLGVKASQLRDEILLKLATSKLLRPAAVDDKESLKDKSTEVATSQVDKAPREGIALAAADTKSESTQAELSTEVDKSNMDTNVATQTSKSVELICTHEEATGTTVVGGEAQSGSIIEENKDSKSDRNPELAIDAIAAAISKLDEGDRRAAEARMESWRELILAKAKTVQSIEKQFPVDGPISFLFPIATQNFLASIPIKYLHGFLSLKKTETGAVCDMFRIWRQKCNLSDMASLALGRHLTSIASRIGLALSSRPIVDVGTREWMLDPIVVLTGAARDFLVFDQKMYSAAEFVEVRTKDLATKLEEWRDRLSMVSLKGSGKVAMISAWKAGAKEAIEAEKYFGKVLHGVNLEAEALSAADVLSTKDGAPEPVLPERVASGPKKTPTKVAAKPIVQVTQHPPPPTKTKAVMPLETDRHLKYTLHSTMFLQDILGKATYELLSSVNVKSAAELFDADKTEGSQLHRAVTDANRAKSVSESKSVIDSWCQSLRTQLDLFRANIPAVVSSPIPPPPPKSAATPPPKRAATPPPKSTKPPPQKKAKIKADMDPLSMVPRRASTPRSFVDPFDGLSNVTKRFLATMKITTAEKFLSSRTTDISVNFVDWRIKENMPELKGLGAIASVSGWKAQVRKFAKEMGLQDLADMEPANKASWGKEAREVSRKEGKEAPRKKIRMKPPPSSVYTLSHENVLLGNSRHVFAVQDESDSKVQYSFELSVRRSDKNQLLRLFATYKGAVLQSSTGGKASKTCTVSLEGSTSDWSGSKLAVLSDIPVSAIGQKGDSCVPFQTMMPGRGLVELRRYGVHHLEAQELTPLKEKLKTFVLSGDVDRPKGAPEVGEANVLIHDAAKGDFQYFLYLDTRIEKGQTVPLRFPDVSTLLRSDKYDSTVFRGRHLISRALHALARCDLCTIRSFLTEEVSDACGSLSDIDDEANISRLRQVVEARQRLHWLSLRVLSLIDDRTTTETLSGLFFDWKAFIGNPKLIYSLPEGHRLDLKQAMAVELKKELLAVLELDQVCGFASRSGWCRLASKLFDALIEGLVAQYCSSAVEPDKCSEAITTIFEKSYSTQLSGDTVDDCILQFRPSGNSGKEEAAEGYQAEPSSAFQVSIQQAYLDAMSLFGEAPYDLEEPHCLEIIFCDGPISGSGGMPTVVTRRPGDVQKGGAVPSVRWYRKHQWEIASRVLFCFTSLIGPTGNAWFNFEKIDSAIREVANKQIDTTSLSDIESESCCPLQLPSPPSDTEKQHYEPHSLQFFLGLVWPALRKLQWRLDAGDNPSEVVYFTPGLPGRSGKLAKLLKKENDHKRAKLAREVNDVGLGFVPKLTKRLLVHAVLAGKNKDKKNGVEDKEENTPVSDSQKADGVTVSVRNILDQFLVYIQSRLKESDQEGRDRANAIVTSMRDCFDALAPNISDAKAESEMEIEASSGQDPCDVLGCDVLMQFLLALPSVLRQPSVPLKEIGDTLAAVQELIDFVVSNYEKLLDERFHPPPEHYLGQHQTNSSALVSRLCRLESSEQALASAGSHEGLTEILLASDNAKLTDYLVRVLEQATPCSATFEDTQKKNRTIEEGFPGLTCRYCLGSGGEGRYFFKTAESLSASTSILDKHFAKCPSVPVDVKSEIVLCKRRHTDQRKFLAVGAQQEFFLRLWDRMWSSKSAGGLTSNAYLAKNVGNSAGGATAEDSNPDSSDSGNVEFHDHITLLDFVRSTKAWKGDNGVQEALEQYYNCLDYGGRIFGTDAMPKNFNSEWLLAKVSPKTFGRKIKGIPG